MQIDVDRALSGPESFAQLQDAELAKSLALLLAATCARSGYVEVAGDTDDVPTRWAAYALDDDALSFVRTRLSTGIISMALASGETVITSSALLDARFATRDSVRAARIEAVLCTPIGADPPIGVIYLEGSQGTGIFTDQQRAYAETIAEHLAALAARAPDLARESDHQLPSGLEGKLVAKNLFAKSPAFVETLKQLALVAPLDVSVLFTGASGTGKSLLARVLHDSGPRSAGPLVELNCAAVPEALAESELFGALPGAHSTATRRIEGKVAAAEGGTLLLDEVGELGLHAQAKLLQLLQSHTYYPLGASRPLEANVRIVAASNTDLEVAMREHRFREDLYYRLHVLPIRVPSLAERRDDIPFLAEHFVQSAAARYRLPVLPLSPAALSALRVAEWPGNVRQLEHALQAALIRATGLAAQQIERAHIFPDMPVGPRSEQVETFQDATRRFQAGIVRQALEDSGWNVAEAARRLDVNRSHLYTLIRAFGLTNPR